MRRKSKLSGKLRKSSGWDRHSEQRKAVERYSQTVDAINLPAVMAAVNRTPKAPRKRRSDARVIGSGHV